MNFRHYLTNCGATQPADIPSVYVVDSDSAAREELDWLIRSAGWQPRMAASAEEFLSRPRVLTPGCLVIEQNLPGISGLALQKVVSQRSELPVIFLSENPDIQIAVQAMKAGAIDFVSKPIFAAQVIGTLRQAIDLSKAAMQHTHQVQALQERYESLSRRELEVMNLVVTGRLNKQVGGELGISEITVKAHRGKLMRKMQAGSFAELVTMVATLRNGASNYAFPE